METIEKKKRGRPKKVQEEVINHGKEKEEVEQTQGDVLTPPVPEHVPEEKPEPVRFREKSEQTDEARIESSRKSLDEPLGPDQKYFESPEGEIFVGPADKDQIWSRHMNHGHGGWVNPRR